MINLSVFSTLPSLLKTCSNRLYMCVLLSHVYKLNCDCSHSPFQYNPSGHVITGDLNIIQHESLRKVISHGPKFREPQHINWKHNFKIIMDAVEDYARRWIKREVDQDPELESLSDWVRTIRSLVQGRIHKLKNCVNSRSKSVFKDQ